MAITVSKIIERVDAERPNVFDVESKFQWITDFEGMVCRVVMQMEEPMAYEYPRDMDRELLIGEPWGRLYALYLEAMIDYHNREYQNYNAVMTMFNSEFEEYKKAYIREVMPLSAGSIRY